MTLTDSGALVPLADVRDPHHARCLSLLPSFPIPLVTTLPCLTEVLHLVRRSGGNPAQATLRRYRADGVLIVHAMTDEEIER